MTSLTIFFPNYKLWITMLITVDNLLITFFEPRIKLLGRAFHGC